MMQSDRKLVIIGAGSLGVMALDAAISSKDYSLEQILFLDDNKKIGTKVHGIEVVGGIKDIYKFDYLGCDFIIAIANNQMRKNIAEIYKVNYVNIIHPAAVVSELSYLGVGNIILPNVSVDPQATIKNHVIINKNTSIGHNVIMLDYSQACPGCQLGGVVGECTFLGLGTTLLPNVKIGRHSTIGAGSVILKDLPDYCTAVGIPAKPIKFHANNS